MADGSRPLCPSNGKFGCALVNIRLADLLTSPAAASASTSRPDASSAVDAHSVAAMSSTMTSTLVAAVAAAGAISAAAASPRSLAFYKAKTPTLQRCNFAAASWRCILNQTSPMLWRKLLRHLQRRRCTVILSSTAETIDFSWVVDQTHNDYAVLLLEESCHLGFHRPVLFGLLWLRAAEKTYLYQEVLLNFAWIFGSWTTLFVH